MKFALLFAIFLSPFTFAKESAVREPASRAQNACSNLNELKKAFVKLDPRSQKDREAGGRELLTVGDCLSSFTIAYDSNHNDKNFASIVQMLAMAFPFDDADGIPGGLADTLTRPKLEVIFQDTMAQMKDACRRDELILAVYSHMCEAKSKNPYCDKLPKADESCNAKLFPPETLAK